MKFLRPAMVATFLVATLLLSNFLNTKVESSKFSESFPAVVCPPNAKAMNTFVSASSQKTQFRKLTGKTLPLRAVKHLRFPITSDPILLNGGEVTSALWQSVTNTWAGATLCLSPRSDEWFVGGAGNITSKGRLLLVNSGLSEAVADIATWSEKGAQFDKSVPVPANSFIQVNLDLLAPGQSRLAIHVTPRSGRISAFMVDERRKGLIKLGGDLITPMFSAKADLVITAIPHANGNHAKAKHVLRLLVPGNLDANIHIELVSTDGTFTPVGLDSKRIARGVVVDIPLNPTIDTSAFSLRIHSDEPLVAGVFPSMSVGGHSDFVWSSPSELMAPLKLAINGLRPTFIFTGDNIAITVTTQLTNGKLKRTSISGTDFASWKALENTQTVSFSEISKSTYGAAIVTSTNGKGTFPLESGSVRTLSSQPTSSIEVIRR